MKGSEQSFFVTGGTLPPNAPSYIERAADDELYAALLRNELCYVLTSRQMGKSSLMVRTAARLRDRGLAVVVLDLTSLGHNVTPEQWYEGLLGLLALRFDLDVELTAFWRSHAGIGPQRRFMAALTEVVLPCLQVARAPRNPDDLPPTRLVVFIDEIDTVRSLPFSTDELFAAIRECHNRRASDPKAESLTFCLLGVATPSDLIRESRSTPFNVGRRIELADFTLSEALPLARGFLPGLAANADDLAAGEEALQHAKSLLARVLYWTGGHPYLTQRLGRALEEFARVSAGPLSRSEVDRLCDEIFFSPRGREQDDNLIFVREHLLHRECGGLAPDAARVTVLELYEAAARQRRVSARSDDSAADVLRLAGVVRAGPSGYLELRNRIYSRVFDRRWIRAHLPNSELRRQQTAFRQGLFRASLAAGLVIAALTTLALTAERQAHLARAASRQSSRQAQQLRVLTASLQTALSERELALTKEKAARSQALQFLNAERQASRRARKEAAKARESETRAREQEQVAWRQSIRAATAEGQAVDQLYLSYLAQARALRWSGRPGQRFAALEVVLRAATIRPSLELRNEAAACLALADLRIQARQQTPVPPMRGSVAFDPDLERFAYADANGTISIRKFADNRELQRIPGAGPVQSLEFSPDGTSLAILYSGKARFCLWSLHERRVLTSLASERSWALARFDSQGSRIVVAAQDGKLHCYSLERERWEPALASVTGTLLAARFDPASGYLAVATDNPRLVRIVELQSGRELYRSAPTGVPHALTWHPYGKQLAIGCHDGQIHLWAPGSGPSRVLVNRSPLRIIEAAFNGDGTVLACYTHEANTELFRTDSGERLLTVPGRFLQYSRSGRLLAFEGRHARRGDLELWEVALGNELRRIQGLRATTAAVFAPDGRMLAAASPEGVVLWDLKKGRSAGLIRASYVHSLSFRQDGRQLFTSGERGLLGWDLAAKVDGSVAVASTPVVLRPRADVHGSALSANGEKLAVVDNGRAWVVPLATPEIQRSMGSHPRALHTAISPNGKWIATGTSEGRDVCVWNAATGAQVRRLSAPGGARMAFTPDGRWLVASTDVDHRYWETSTWTLRRVKDRENDGARAEPVILDRNGAHQAVRSTLATARLLDPATGKTYLELEAAEPQRPWCFSPDGNQLVVTNESGHVRIWDLAAVRRELRRLGLGGF